MYLSQLLLDSSFSLKYLNPLAPSDSAGISRSMPDPQFAFIGSWGSRSTCTKFWCISKDQPQIFWRWTRVLEYPDERWGWNILSDDILVFQLLGFRNGFHQLGDHIDILGSTQAPAPAESISPSGKHQFCSLEKSGRNSNFFVQFSEVCKTWTNVRKCCKTFEFQHHQWNKQCTSLKTNTSPENRWLEDEVSLFRGHVGHGQLHTSKSCLEPERKIFLAPTGWWFWREAGASNSCGLGSIFQITPRKIACRKVIFPSFQEAMTIFKIGCRKGLYQHWRQAKISSQRALLLLLGWAKEIQWWKFNDESKRPAVNSFITKANRGQVTLPLTPIWHFKVMQTWCTMQRPNRRNMSTYINYIHLHICGDSRPSLLLNLDLRAHIYSFTKVVGSGCEARKLSTFVTHLS